jgi:ADP-ribose pyrophosphatase
VEEGVNSIQPLDQRLLHRGRKYDFELVRVRTASGHEIEHSIVRHPGAVVILPILEGRNGLEVVFVRNERVSVMATLWELPAGTREAGEEPDLTARRELIEETGYDAATIEPLTRFYTTPGMTDELMHAYVARGLRPVGQNLEVDEQLTVHPVPVAEAFAMIDSGLLRDGKSILTLSLARLRGLV